jgi:hypothetical protein
MSNNQSMQTGFLLRQLAKNAKQRMKNQNYQGENSLIKKMGQRSRQNISHFNTNYNFDKGQITIKMLDDSCQTDFCRKVRSFLEKLDHTKIVNPINELADKKYMNSLSALERQRYIFDIAEKYNKIKDDYYSEQLALNA